jgi:hypothetical protein
MTRKAKPFEIRFFYEPDGQQLIYYWEKASKLGIKQSEFDKIWFKAYENFRALIIEVDREELLIAAMLSSEKDTFRLRSLFLDLWL